MAEHGAAVVDCRDSGSGPGANSGCPPGRAPTATVKVTVGLADPEGVLLCGDQVPPATALAVISSARAKPPGPGELHLDAVVADGGGTLVLTGEVDLATAWRLGEALRSMHDKGVSTIVVDLGGLRFIDSSGLHQLVVAVKRQRLRNGDVVLRAPSASILRVLEIVGFTTLFRIT